MTDNCSLRMRPSDPEQFRQLGVLVIDGSGSMQEMTVGGNITKAEATAVATRELFSRLKDSSISQGFQIGLITYDHRPTAVIDPPLPVAQLDLNADYNPLRGHGGNTRIDLALEEAERIVDNFLKNAPSEGVDYSAVLIVMSDGLCHEPQRTRDVASRLKQRFGSRLTLAAAFFAAGKDDPQGEQLLRDIVTSPTFFSTVRTGDQLREFFRKTFSEALVV
jgi:uncharacterized protein YegL